MLRISGGGDVLLAQVSLWQYLYCADVAADLHRGGPGSDFNSADYTLAIPPDHFRSLVAACRDRKHVTSLARELVSRVACAAAGELARVYEYQLAFRLTDWSVDRVDVVRPTRYSTVHLGDVKKTKER